MALIAAAFSPVLCVGQVSTVHDSVSIQKSASVAGTVLKAVTHEPLRSAKVVLESGEDSQAPRSTFTDSNGHFRLRGIVPGRYRLEVSHNGFVTQGYAQKSLTGPGAELILGPDQTMADLLFRMVPTAVISGEVLNEVREPLPWISILALRETYSGGKLALKTIEEVTTNDLGQYRLFNLSPGRYYVLAINHLAEFATSPVIINSPSPNDELKNQGYVPTFFPGTVNFATAEILALDAGAERPNIDFVLAPVPVFSISGKVSNVITNQAIAEVVKLHPRGYWPVGSFPDYHSLVDEKTGEFRITNVPAGSYHLVASSSDAGGVHYGRLPIEVSSVDVTGSNILIALGVSLSGRIVWDTGSLPENTEMYVVMGSTDGTPVSKSVRVDQDSSFLFRDVTEGDYTIGLYNLPRDAYLKSARSGPQDVLENGLTVRRAPLSVQITLSSLGARVEGTVVDSNLLPAAGVRVTLLSRNEARLGSSIQEATTDQNGRFNMRGIAPGDYRLYSWAGAEQNFWEDSGLIKSLQKQGQEITLNEGERKEIALRLIEITPNVAP
jgi:hypothetical protein